ncbi:MAG: hypothetical protein ABI162_07075 [Luteolibacter sp.]
MNKLVLILIFALFTSCSSCSSIHIGQDPVVVNAERTTQVALDAFDAVEKIDLDGYASFKMVNPKAAAAERTFVNNLRAHQYEWVTSARTATKAYKNNRDAAHKATLDTAIIVLVTATREANKYIMEIHSAAQP